MNETYLTIWRDVCFHPTSFFRRMPREDGFGGVLLYYLILAVIVAGINLFWRSLFNFLDLATVVHLPMVGEGSSAALVEFLLTPLFAAVGLALATVVCHSLLLLMRDGEQGFQTSARVFAYSYSPALFAIIPLLGTPVAFVWMIVVSIIGLRESHETDGAKAAAAVLLPAFLLVGLVVVATIAAVALGLLNTRI